MRNVPVVFVHGLWLTGAESALMRRRLASAHGLECHSFSYQSVGRTMSDVIERLARFVERLDAERLHFVGHSLGGLVLYRYFESYPSAPPGRVVFLGSPTVRSLSAERVGRVPVASSMIGRLVRDELARPTGTREWRHDRELGVIAGTRPLGLGRFFARFDEQSDGTVAVSETKLPGHHAHIALPVSHMGMLASRAVADHVGRFLANGAF
ncbi:MAG TPA: alpha/beta hydrolase family protein [Steroidobacteraceae bacterium]|jgi:pimeloyl-ACP methyl ester carboxylesterase|nr:alpha/beta hydrolase family protein [Steroidobacteraceae bacterium]